MHEIEETAQCYSKEKQKYLISHCLKSTSEYTLHVAYQAVCSIDWKEKGLCLHES